MTETSFQIVAYMLAALLFILALAGLSQQKTAKRGNYLGIIGMSIALVATIAIALLHADAVLVAGGLMLAAIVVGGAFGVWTAVAILVDLFCLWMVFRPERRAK